MAAHLSPLSNVTEGSINNVVGEDLPPNPPRRKQRFDGSRSVSATGEVVITHHDSVEPLVSIHEENDDTRPRRKFSKSGSGRSRSQRSGVVGAEEKKEERPRPPAQERTRRSRSSGSRSRHSSRSARKRSHGAGREGNTKKISRSQSRRRLPSHDRRSSSTSDLFKTKQIANGTNMSNRSNSLRNLPSHHGRSSSTSDLKKSEQEANRMKSSRSNSLRRISSHRRRSSSISDLMKAVDCVSGASQHGEKCKKKARGKSNGRSLSTSSHRKTTIESSKTTVVGDDRRHSSSSRSLSSTHSSDWSFQSDSVTQESRTLDARGAQDESRTSRSESEHSASQVSEEEEVPGAYRVSFHSTSRVMSFRSLASSSGHTFAVPDDDNLSDSIHSFASSHESPASSSTVVAAEVARDVAEEIEAAREQGRAEGLVQASNHDRSMVVAVASQPRRLKTLRINTRKKGLLVLAFCVCFIMIIGPAAYFVLNRQEENEPNTGTMAPKDSTELDAVISFDPPTAEDCEAIANGTEVAGQADMFVQFVDMHVEISMKSEEEAAFLVRLLKQQIQLNLIPRLVGCDDLEGNVVGNGFVDSRSNETSTCLFQNNPLCLEVVLTVKIYLRRKEDGSTVLDIMSELLLDEDLNDSLELPPSVESVSIPVIAPSNFSTSVPTETPSWSPSVSNVGSIVGSPSARPITGSPSVEPTSRKIPTIYTEHPTIEPTLQRSAEPTSGPSRVHSSSPTLDFQFSTEPLLPVPSAAPSWLPTESPSETHPTVSPSTSPSTSPLASPSASPSMKPTRVPSRRPTSVPSTTPTRTPSSQPTTSPPSSTPTSTPSTSPSVPPSESPTATFSPSESPTTTPQPSVSGFFWVACGNSNFCSGKPASVQNANHVTIDGIPSTVDQDMIAVRCCSDTYKEGFSGPRKESCPYAESKIDRGCYNTATYWEAENLCSSVGARLCTLEEIENNCAAGSGCGHNYRMAWTSTQGSPL